MNNFVQEGNVINHLNSGAALASGDVVAIGDLWGICVADIAANAIGAVRIGGVVDLAALTTDTFAVGQILYWDTTNDRLTETAAAWNTIGICLLAKDGATAVGRVLLNEAAYDIDLLDVSAGVATASKALVLGADKNVDLLAIADGGLRLGAAAGTAVLSTAAELNILDGVTATGPELNMAADNSANVEVVAATNVITAAESGKTFFLNIATGFASTLPAPAAGLRYKFIVTLNPTTAYTVGTNAGADIIEGDVLVNAALVIGANEDLISFVANLAIVGDWVEVISDGTSWFVTGMGHASGAITLSAT